MISISIYLSYDFISILHYALNLIFAHNVCDKKVISFKQQILGGFLHSLCCWCTNAIALCTCSTLKPVKKKKKKFHVSLAPSSGETYVVLTKAVKWPPLRSLLGRLLLCVGK